MLASRTTLLRPSLAVLMLAGAALFSAAAGRDHATAAPIAPAGAFIVRLRDNASDLQAAAASSRVAARPRHRFRRTFQGFAAHLTGAQVAALRRDPAVAGIYPDVRVSLWNGRPKIARLARLSKIPGGKKSNQKIPTGVARVGGPRSATAAINRLDLPLNVDVAVLDTGIDPAHQDLSVAGGFSTDGGGWHDDNGHGTHVAGIAAARDNTWGVVGVAPGARLWSVKVLDANGVGRLSDIMAGMEWVVEHADVIEVANLSFAADAPGDDFFWREGVNAMVNAGVTVVAAAGNESVDTGGVVPARFENAIAVSAMADKNGRGGRAAGKIRVRPGYTDFDESFADFSNHGSVVDLIAPGVMILSTLPGNRYGYYVGTSQAAPHVAGAAALYRITHPSATPAEVRAALVALGTPFLPIDDPDGIHEPALEVSSL